MKRQHVDVPVGKIGVFVRLLTFHIYIWNVVICDVIAVKNIVVSGHLYGLSPASKAENAATS